MDELADFAVEIASNERTKASAHDWHEVFAGLTVDECKAILRTFARDVKISPTDFRRARARLLPAYVCPACSNTGLLDAGLPCSCQEGERMEQIRAALATVPTTLDKRPPLGPSGFIAALMRRKARGDESAARELLDLPDWLLAGYEDRAREIATMWEDHA